MSLLEVLEAELKEVVQEFDKDASVMVQLAAGGLHRIRQAIAAERAATPTPAAVEAAPTPAPAPAPEAPSAPVAAPEGEPHVA